MIKVTMTKKTGKLTLEQNPEKLAEYDKNWKLTFFDQPHFL